MQVRIWDPRTGKPVGDALKGHSKWITSLAWEPIHLYVLVLYRLDFLLNFISNPSFPRLASSSKDGTVRVWSLLTRRTEYTLGGHTASVNVVKWGGAGADVKGIGHSGVLYTASSDRTVRIWDADTVRSTPPSHTTLYSFTQGHSLHVLKDHAHWVTTLALNTDFVLRTGPFDHKAKKPANDEEGTSLSFPHPPFHLCPLFS